MKHSLKDLFRTLLENIRALLREELLLIKTELSEKASHAGRSVASLAIGGVAACMGLVVLLMGLGLLLAWAFTIAGLPELLAGFVGLLVIGLAVGGGGAAVLFKALRSLSKESLVPEKSIQTLQHLKEVGSSHAVPQPENFAHEKSKPQAVPKLSTDELKNVAFATEETLAKTLDELKQRVSPRQVARRMKRRIASHPARAGAIALATALAGTLLVRRRLRRA